MYSSIFVQGIINYRLLYYVLIGQAGAGFRIDSSCTDQVLVFISYIEAGFHKGVKTACAFLDLSSAYDTVWNRGMVYYKL